MRWVRIVFSKKGSVKYISHLDLMRAFTLAVRRTDLPIWYTEGYNPRPYLDFPRPLALGIEGERELLDVKIDGEASNEKIRDELDRVMPPGLSVLSVSEPKLKAKDIAFAAYEAIYSGSVLSKDMADTALTSGELKCEKRGKIAGRKVIKEVDLTPYTSSCSVHEAGDQTILHCVLPCNNTENINILNICEGISKLFGDDVRPDNTVRLKLLDEQKNEAQ